MRKKLITSANIIFLIILIILISFFIPKFSEKENPKPQECIEVNKVTSLAYETCYDEIEKTIYIELKRTYDTYNINQIKIKFYDTAQKEFLINNVPIIGKTEKYRISATKNPKNLNVFLNITKDFDAPICQSPRIVYVKDCYEGKNKTKRNITIEITNTSKNPTDYIQILPKDNPDSDILDSELVKKERIWKSLCEPKWVCSPWESCVNGVQKRDCIDRNKCIVPTGEPEETRLCDNTCIEKWECEWSKCIDGYTTPKCVDINSCGTKDSKPQKIQCKSPTVRADKCEPDITCTEWTECKADYNFFDLINGVENIKGIKSRMCTDKNSCTNPAYEIKDCSIKMDVYIKKFTRCNQEYTGVYNKLDNKMIAKIEQSEDPKNPQLNIQLMNGESEEDIHCDSCSNGIKDNDEEKTDCGGSCEACESDSIIKRFRESKSFFQKVSDFIKRLLS